MALRSTAYQVCSQAVLALGGMPITDAETAERRFLEYNYDDIKKNLLSIHDWKFATRRQYPAYRSSSNGYYIDAGSEVLRPLYFEKKVRFRSEHGRIFLDEDGGHFYYIKNVSEDEMPSFFKRALVDFLIAHLAPMMTESMSRTDFFTRKAEHSLRVAKKADEALASREYGKITDFAFISARR